MLLSEQDIARRDHLERVAELADEIADARAKAKALTDEQTRHMVIAKNAGATYAQLMTATGMKSPRSVTKRLQQVEDLRSG